MRGAVSMALAYNQVRSMLIISRYYFCKISVNGQLTNGQLTKAKKTEQQLLYIGSSFKLLLH